MSDNEEFDIEHFPTSPTALRMLSRVSPIYDRAYVGKWIYQVMGLGLDEVRLRFNELPDQAFPETATWGLKYWEQRYGLTDTEGKSIALRRQEVLSYRGAKAPLNPKKVEAILSAITGREVVVTEDVAPYTFAVEVLDGDSGFDYAAVIRRIKRLKPSHQAFTFRLTLPTATIRSGLFTESRLTVEVWPETVEAVEAAQARVLTGAALGQRIAANVWPGTVTRAETTAKSSAAAATLQTMTASVQPATAERVEATAKTGAVAGTQQDTVTRVWPGAVETVETKAGAAGIIAELHQTIEIWP
jgi:hypothetical protein